MKRSFAITVGLLTTFLIFAQYPKKIELYDVVKMFAPDSVKGDNYPSAYDWKIGSDKKSPLKWNTEGLEIVNDKTVKQAEVIVSINDSTIKTGLDKEMPWYLVLSGARMGFMQYEIRSPIHPDIKAKTTIEELFPNKKYTATLIKSCEKNRQSGFYFYEVIIPGKKKMQMKVSWDVPLFNSLQLKLTFYTDFRDSDSKCTTE